MKYHKNGLYSSVDSDAYLEGVIIHPDYRGRRLQLLLYKKQLNNLPNQITKVICTVHPENSSSKKNIIESGFSILPLQRCMAQSEKYISTSKDKIIVTITRSYSFLTQVN